MGKTKAQIANDIQNEFLATAAGTPDDELKEWSCRVFGDLKAADNALHEARSKAHELDAARKEARSAHRRSVNAETSSAWRVSVAAAEEAQEILREARDNRNRLQALSGLLSNLLRQRRCGPEDSVGGTDRKRATGRTPAPQETCPFCEHTYTVRDGTLTQTDGEGNRLQLRICQCREMAPPCRNCPACKDDAAVMGAEGEEQLRICREELQCQICACECPGAGKWIEGDEDSRARFQERTTKRHSELSALLQSSWSGGDEGARRPGLSGLREHLAPSLRRLPADIKNQLEAAAAAESLQFSAFHDTGGPSASAGTSLACGRVCCGETLATVKRRKLDRSNIPAASADAAEDHPHHRKHAGMASKAASEGCGDHCEHSNHHHHHGEEHAEDEERAQHAQHAHHHHVHRCEHPHDECTSGCCSAVSQT